MDSIVLSITLIIIILTAIVSVSAFSNEKIVNDMIFYPARMKGGKEMHRLMTHGFIHADFFHLFVNMLTLWFFGRYAEAEIFSKTEYILLYATAIPAASLFDLFKHKDDYQYRALGTSGAVSAVLFSTILVDPWMKGVCIYGVLCLPNILFGVLYIVYSAYMGKRGGDNVGHNAHLWGAVYGLAFTAITHPEMLQNFLTELANPKF